MKRKKSLRNKEKIVEKNRRGNEENSKKKLNGIQGGKFSENGAKIM